MSVNENECFQPHDTKFETPINLKSHTFKPFLKLCSSPDIFEPKPTSPAIMNIGSSLQLPVTPDDASRLDISDAWVKRSDTKDYKVIAKAIRNYGKKGLEHNETIIDLMFKLHLQLVPFEHHQLFPPNDTKFEGLDKNNSAAKFKVSANINNRCSSSYTDLKVNYISFI